MSSRPDTYRVIVAGDEELGYSYCAKLLDKRLTDPRQVAKESLEKTWPDDEWTKHITVSNQGVITTMEIDLELHGPWVWELYSTLEPRDYFRRFAGLILCADPDRENLPSELSNFIESMNIHTGDQIPTILIVDRSRRWKKGQIDSLREIAENLSLPIFFIRLDTGENIDESFKSLASDISEVNLK
ncbi:MAG: GTPase domain-containing protein [Candidatus Thorarchaeota archaeon]|nr:GTPase domain-containing protein [Candidatus Thorarchaeota archaeon]